ncbi:ShlB/FhaC/HecB family hemolysin secretion/activation protein [Roseibium sp. TrichSKD4]|uniref:ShlB/FhaC/HecB family hemolysin secretion/activation protein n=1 Tax=Roseibium sp. TrichSKD4 TaxID=744980 RepID=UPI001112A143|nr:ShlB/FhaC/HecB family hemolysin secretion/activation protein [Roseibium sp. TrichSKD4]
MNIIFKLFLFACALLALLSLAATAQVTPTPGGVGLDPQRRQRDFLNEQQRRQNELVPPAAVPADDVESKPAEAKKNSDPNAVCINIQKVIFEEATLFGEDALHVNVPDSSCFTLDQIVGLVRDTTNLYISAGYVTSRAYLPEQDLSSGTLRLVVIEGRIEAVELYQNGVRRHRGEGIIPVRKGEILHIRSIEQGLDQINGLSSKDAKISFRPGSEQGTSIVVIEIKSGRQWQATVGFDNSGADNTGKAQFDGSIVVEDIFGLFETISLSHKNSDPTIAESRLSGNTALSISVPRGNWTGRWTSTFYNYVSQIEGLNQQFELSGTNWSHDAQVERLLIRDQVSKTYARFGMSVKDARNFLEDTLIETSSRILSVARLELAHTRRVLGGALSLQAGIDQGTTLFGAPNDSRAPARSPKAQFTKLDAEVSFFRQWQAGPGTVSANTRLTGQYSPHRLFGSEQLGIGGISSVRGFDRDSLSAENGFYVRNELGYTPEIFEGTLAKYLGKPTLFAGLDAGWQLPGPTTPKRYETVTGAAFGARLQGGIAYGEVSYELPLSYPSSFSGDPVLRVRAGLVLSRF